MPLVTQESVFKPAQWPIFESLKEAEEITVLSY